MCVVALLFILVLAGTFILHKQYPSVIPKNIAQKAAFSIFFPNPVPGLAPDTSTLAYSTANAGLSYTVRVDKKKVVVSEQAKPDVFSENGVYSFKLNQAHEYSSFDSSAGEVTLTRPAGLHNQTVAWVNAKGTLTLARAYQSLTLGEWKLLFNNMVVVN